MEPTKVFISWSGERSKQLALALRDWLDDVLQSIEPWMSDQDIGAGRLWGPELDVALEGSFYGIICVTPDNPEKPWLNYEAGALAKKLSVGAVVPYLLEMEPTELPNVPLSRFQCAKADEQGTWEVLVMLNKSRDTHAMSSEKLRRSFDQWWPALNAKIMAIPPRQLEMKARTSEDKLDELIEGMRQLVRSQAATPPLAFPIPSVREDRQEGFTSHFTSDLLPANSYRSAVELLRIKNSDRALAALTKSAALQAARIIVNRVEIAGRVWSIDFAIQHSTDWSLQETLSFSQQADQTVANCVEFAEREMLARANAAKLVTNDPAN